MNWREHFPLASPRQAQIDAIEFALKELYDNDKDCVVLELGLGTGKSAVAMTLANYVAQHPFGKDEDEEYDNGTYVLTSQKVLQQQYVHDFSKAPCEIKNLVSSANFDCTGRPGAKCADSMRVYSALGERFPPGPRNHCRNHCPYKKQKGEFLQSLTGVTNYAYFLAETMYAGQLKPRRLLVVDECHNIESNVSKFVELKISQKFSEVALKVKFTKDRDPVKIKTWIDKKYEPALSKQMKQLVSDIEKCKDDRKTLTLSEQLEVMDKHICKVHRLQKTWDPKNWIVNRERVPHREFDVIEFKPIDVSAWTHDMMLAFGQKRVLLSATILDRDFYMKSIGLDPAKTAFLSIDSPFDTKNRPIFYVPIGKMSYNKIEESMPKMVSMIAELLKSHPDEKGIIHTVNFRVADAIKSLNDKRLLVQSKDVSRDQLLEAHLKSKDPTVLVSPSMTEGVDLKDDLSRFQIFCKVPFPSLADEMIKKKSEKDDRYYSYVTAQSIVQATGRSVRNEKDWAVTYILDECAEDFFRKNRHLFPKSFLDSLQDLDGRAVCK